MIMCDWLTVKIPYPHNDPLNNGNVISVDKDGTIEYKVDKFLPVRGSFASTINIRSHLDSDVEYLFNNGVIPFHKYSHLILSGNPVKYLQGHNLWGSNDIQGLLNDCYRDVLSKIGKSEIYDQARLNRALITRIDLNASYHLNNENDVNAWLRSAEQSATLKHRGKGQFTHGTLYFGKGSSRWMIKFYHKGQEIKANSKNQRIDLLQLKEATTIANKSLRCELQFRTKELVKMRLTKISDWSEDTPLMVYNRYSSKLEFSDNTMNITPDKVEHLSRQYKNTYKHWVNGEDLRTILSKSTFYKHRRLLLDELNIDISIKQDTNNPDLSNVLPIIRVLDAKPAKIPDWAYGTDMYYEPNTLRSV